MENDSKNVKRNEIGRYIHALLLLLLLTTHVRATATTALLLQLLLPLLLLGLLLVLILLLYHDYYYYYYSTVSTHPALPSASPFGSHRTSAPRQSLADRGWGTPLFGLAGSAFRRPARFVMATRTTTI